MSRFLLTRSCSVRFSDCADCGLDVLVLVPSPCIYCEDCWLVRSNTLAGCDRHQLTAADRLDQGAHSPSANEDYARHYFWFSLTSRRKRKSTVNPEFGIQLAACILQCDNIHQQCVASLLLANFNDVTREQHVFKLVALAVAVFHEARKATLWQTPEIATAVCVAVSLAFSISCDFISWFCIEWKMQDAIQKYMSG
jgi:hypothetical protein